MGQHEINDGTRTLRFEGEKLAHSSSRHPDSQRWIEFTLYKTVAGTYVLSRVGVSKVYHSSVCSLVEKYNLNEVSGDKLASDAEKCEFCWPSASDPLVYPEHYRYWTMTSRDAEAVVDALYKYDANDARYLTKVASRLLEQASEVDPEIDAAYRIETIL